MDVGGIKTCGPQHVGIHGGAEREMAADADAHGTQLTGTVRARLQMVEHGARVRVEAGKFFGGLQYIARGPRPAWS